MSVHHLLPPMPDLGKPQQLPHPTLAGEHIVNVAGVIAVARSVASKESLAFYRAFCARWDTIKVLPLPEGERQRQAVQLALADVGQSVDFLDMDKVANPPEPRP